MFRPKFKEIWKWGIIATLSLVLGVAMNDIEKFQIGLKYFWILSLVVSFFISLAIVQITWVTFPRIIHFFTTPNRKNLRLYPGSLINNVYTLKFMTTEWRYLFNRSNAYANIDLVPASDYSHLNGRLEWQKQNAIRPLEIMRFIPYDLNFLEINPSKNEFCIKTQGYKDLKFSPDKYGFMIKLTSNIFGDFKIKENLLFYKIDFKSTFQAAYLIVDYKGGRNISVKTIDEQEYEENKWYQKINWDERSKPRNLGI